jgi:hypothetical protein
MENSINRRRVFIKVFAWLFLLMGLGGIQVTIYFNYLKQEWLIGRNYFPADFTNTEMISIYSVVLMYLLLSISSLLVIINYKRGYEILFYTLLFFFFNIFWREFTEYHYRYILNHRLLYILVDMLLYGIPTFLIWREVKGRMRQKQFNLG